MRERVIGSPGKGLLVRRAGAAALVAVFTSAGLARGTTSFQAAYIAGTSGPPAGGTTFAIFGNQFQAGATVTIGGAPAGGVTFKNASRIHANAPSAAAGGLYDVVVTNPGGPSSTLPSAWMADFNDVDQSNPFHAAVETILRDGITTGCTGGNYCPNANINRDQMAVFLLKAEHGSGYIPPACAGIFADVQCPADPTFPYSDWIEQLSNEGITGGCAPPGPPTGLPSYCPGIAVTRGQMAVFLLKVYHGVFYQPPPATGVFGDVNPSDPLVAPFAPWIEEIARLQVTVGCGNGNYCPAASTTRGQMAIFMTKALHRPQATRFLEQATWGPKDADISAVLGGGVLPWMATQFSLFPSLYPALLLWPDSQPASCTGTCPRDNYGMYPLQTRFFTNALYSPDQLRQRVNWALHKLVVISGSTITHPSRMAPYLNLLDGNAFGNYRDILYGVTLNPAMGHFLNMDTSTTTNPNENYAREIMQLFSIGTVLLNRDGTTQDDINGIPLPSYDQSVIDNLKKVLTGWYIQNNVACDPVSGAGSTCRDYLNPMSFNTSKHDASDKTLFTGFLPNQNAEGAPTLITGDSAGYSELNSAIDALFNHPNLAPYLARELIHSLVTSNPSPAYIERVAYAFDEDGGGNRGSLWSVTKAIMLDPEARNLPSDPIYGKLKEPEQHVLNILRAFNAMSANRLTTSDGNLNGQVSPMGQSTFRPATVFSYFPQDYFAPPASAELFGPEFGIMDASTSLKRANFIYTMTFNGGINPSPPDTPNGTSIDLTELQQLAPNSANLVDRLSRLMMHGTMSDEMRNSIIGAVNAVTPATDTLKRARQALYLVATASQYQVQR